MASRNLVPILITFAAVFALAASFIVYQQTATKRSEAAKKVLAAHSDLVLTMKVVHATGPIAEEDYAMSDDDGLSKSRYRVLGRRGLQITIDERPRVTIEDGPNVAFFFQQAVLDGVWELTNKPPRGDTSTTYTVYVYQLDGTSHGSRTYTFTDPAYWATTGGHQYHITLSKNKPVPNLLTMTSTTLVEPRYQKIVDDFRAFGPQSFRDKVLAAQLRLKAHG